MSEIQKKKRISKKNKSAWRKTDIKDVEEYLEEQRQEERIGTFEDKADQELFQVDVAPSEANKKKLLTEKQKRKLNAKKPMKSYQILENTSKVQDPIVKRNIIKNQKKAGRNIEEEVYNPKKPRDIKATQDRLKTYAKVEAKLQKKAAKVLDNTKDLWVEEDFRDKIPGLKDEKGWISKDLSVYHAQQLGLPVFKVHDSIRHRTTKAKTFEPPHPGISYNPSLEDHQKLIAAVVEKEEKIIKENKHLKRVTTQMFSKVTPEERERLRLKEMSAGMDDDEEEEQENENKNGEATPSAEDDAPYRTINPPVENKKKSKTARNKELKQKELQKKLEEKRALKKQIADLNRIKSLKAEVLAEEEELNELKKRRKKTAFKKKFEPKRLGRLKYVEPDQDLTMPEDLAGNMRNIKQESSLLVDRFKNFQKRNILPVSVATGKQKAPKVKRFPRNSHKDPGVSYQMLREQRLAQKKKAAAPAMAL
ncbi:ribosome biogenesis protein NOP53 [Lucilia sericata]|uniref:ribosome biogenesis protein NOP53 n=1 Tax=Lucilia sericata TaxID=13632 RepID=UPI0018A80506|nr:ribosome biogenesis protein NOP53 [Lucilia sericata]